MTKKLGHRFQKGNQAAKGNPGPWEKRKFLTQALISQLNEVDATTDKEIVHRIIAELIKHAVGFEVRTVRKDRSGKVIETTVEQVPSSVIAIREIFDRVEGRSVAAVEARDGEGGGVVLLFPQEYSRI